MDSPVSVKTSNIYSPSSETRARTASSPQTYRIVSIEGNIGSGKTTLLANLKKELSGRKDVVFLREPVDDWDTIRDAEGQTMLQKFYANQEKYSFPFQMMAYITRLTLLRDAIRSNPNAIIVTERSLYTDKYVFAKMLHDGGKIEDVNYSIYMRWFDSFIEDCQVEQIVYVKTEPTLCQERIGKRSRAGESGIPLAYLEECHKYHEAMLDQTCGPCISSEQIVIDGNMDIYENEINLRKMVEDVLSFIQVEEFAAQSESFKPLKMENLASFRAAQEEVQSVN